MARGGNMIVTLVAQTKNFSKGLQNAGKTAQGFGRVVGGAMNMALGAIGLLATSIIMFLPNFIKMGEEARKSELKLANVAKQMGLFGENTEIVTRRMSKYAEDLYRLTGVNDDLIRENQAILLTFKQLAKSADTVGGAFDRATELTLDLAAVMKTDSSSAAKQLGKVLQDPVKQLGALTKAGVTFTDKEREKIEALVRSNKLLEAQDLILDAIETQVGGTAAETASSVDKMVAAFDIMGGELSEALLPAVDAVADAMSEWLASEDGKKAVENLEQAFRDFAKWIQSPDGKKTLENLYEVLLGIGEASYKAGLLIKGTLDAFKAFSDWINSPENAWWVAAFQNEIPVGDPRRPVIPNPNPSAPGPPPRLGASEVTVNVSGITPTAAIGRTVQNALNTARRLGVR
jgi:methyl-accepting chemotaxis protein